jgi:hypothetical protein
LSNAARPSMLHKIQKKTYIVDKLDSTTSPPRLKVALSEIKNKNPVFGKKIEVITLVILPYQY